MKIGFFEKMKLKKIKSELSKESGYAECIEKLINHINGKEKGKQNAELYEKYDKLSDDEKGEIFVPYLRALYSEIIKESKFKDVKEEYESILTGLNIPKFAIDAYVSWLKDFNSKINGKVGMRMWTKGIMAMDKLNVASIESPEFYNKIFESQKTETVKAMMDDERNSGGEVTNELKKLNNMGNKKADRLANATRDFLNNYNNSQKDNTNNREI